MKVFVTGGTGFLGREVVKQLAEAGHSMTVLVRSASTAEFEPVEPEVRLVEGDLRKPQGWSNSVQDHDVVVHMAMGLGSFSDQFATNVIGTERLLSVLEGYPKTRLVHISTFSVYDYAHLRTGALVTEDSALEARPTERDAYTQTKLFQETLVREFAESIGRPTMILRPGAIFGPTREWNYGKAFKVFGNWYALVSPNADMKLVSVKDCARAIVMSVEAAMAGCTTLNIVNDSGHTYGSLHSWARQHGVDSTRCVPVPYRVMELLTKLIELFGTKILRKNLNLPGFLKSARLAAEYKPLRYSNDRARATLRWTPTDQR